MGIEHAALIMTQDQIDHDREGWLKRRLDGITASEIPVVLGVVPPKWGSPFGLYCAKLDGRELDIDSDGKRRGRYLEPYVRDLYEESRPDVKLTGGGLWASRARPWQMATFDSIAYEDMGLVVERSWPVQLKTAYNDIGWNADFNILPVYYWCQAIWEMDTWGADQVEIPVLFIGSWRLSVVVITRDDPKVQLHIEMMRAEAELFLDRVAREDPPPIDWTPATARALRSLNPDLDDEPARVTRKLADRYDAARAARAAADQRLGQVENELLAAMGPARRAVAVDRETGKPRTVVSRSQYPHPWYDSKALRAGWPDVAAQVRRETPVDSLRAGSWRSR
jgi:predicted phage-related endonuclease